jgi:hypothetical protein
MSSRTTFRLVPLVSACVFVLGLVAAPSVDARKQAKASPPKAPSPIDVPQIRHPQGETPAW